MPKDQDYQFSGFTAPTYTMVPDQIFDELLGQITGNELKVLLYIVRRTFGFRKDADAISLNQFSDGITKRDGTVLDNGAGVSKRGAAEAVKGLVAKGIIKADGQVDDQGGSAPTLYRLCFALNGSVNGVANIAMGGGKYYQPRVAKKRVAPMQNLLPQQTDVQQTEIQDIEPESGDDSLANSEETPTFSPWIAQVVLDHATELGNKGSGAINVDKALRLWQRSGLAEAEFVELLNKARAATRKAQGTQGGVANKVARFIAELERLVHERGH